MKPGRGRDIGRAAAATTLLWAVTLHLAFFGSAGALWRDEANSAAQAGLPSWQAVWESLRYDTFPILYPALLRCWVSTGAGGTDHGLRILGLLTGVGLVASVWCAGRLLGARWPVVSAVLVSAGPLVISEGDSVRPYGLALIGLVWAYVALARYAGTGSSRWLAAASLFAILAAHSGYANAVQIGVLTLSGFAAGLFTTRRRVDWAALLPGLLAAATLVVYVPALRIAAEWAAIVRQPVDWRAFAARFVDMRSVIFGAVWVGASVMALTAFRRGGAGATRSAQDRWCGMVAVAAVPVQLGFLWLQAVPPFPRYFLTALLPLALSLDVLSRSAAWRMHFVAAALLLTAMPSWSALRQRRTNADAAGTLLTSKAGPRDLVVVSPWFLHPSFQRYYEGSAAWVTAPVLPPAPVMRYDLVKAAMLQPAPAGDPGPAIAAALRGGGSIWLVTQRSFRSAAGPTAPERPEPHGVPDGRDYVRFRSYWERGVEHELASCCAVQEHSVEAGRVWDEEDLTVVRWAVRSR